MSVAIIALALAAAAAEEHGPYCEVQGDKLVPTGQVSAEKLDWYNSDKPVVFSKKKYIKYGMPQIMGIDDLQYWQTKDKVPVMLGRRELPRHHLRPILDHALRISAVPDREIGL